MAMKWLADRRTGHAGITATATPRRRLRAQADLHRTTRVRLRRLTGRLARLKSAKPAFTAPAFVRLAIPAGLEPATLSFEGWYSIHRATGPALSGSRSSER